MNEQITELEKFNVVLRKVLSVSREEMVRRDKEWKQSKEEKKAAKSSPFSRA